MTYRSVLWVSLGCAAIGACGPSAAEVKAAKEARYACDYPVVLRAVKEVVEEQQPPLELVDPDRGIVASQFRWHDKNGLRKKPGTAFVAGDDVQFAVIAQIEETPAGFAVALQARVLGHITGSPQPFEIEHKDGNWPAWADVKVDDVQLQVHKRLGECVVAAPAAP